MRAPKAFYEKALAPLGYALIMEVEQEVEKGFPAAGFGIGGKPDFWIGGEGGLDRPVHIAIVAKDRAAVDAFHKAALAAGGKGQRRARNPCALSSGLLRRLRARSGRAQYRGGLPRSRVTVCRIHAARHIPLSLIVESVTLRRVCRAKIAHAIGASAFFCLNGILSACCEILSRKSRAPERTSPCSNSSIAFSRASCFLPLSH